eukprot:TRINITY_DN42079_c0_g1_i1.p1 TRINITY_DN42079_c0_g1~~TRINITY_DN42079_c0_g1_i1.p1  ORF type:complete len:274 (+),score=74.84 TRINITY_DN42079_c0_g1_i1:27-848(+)
MTSKMKRLFRKSKWDATVNNESLEESTLENILREKEEESRKIEAEEKDFQRLRRVRERKLIMIEEEELLKRESERDQRIGDLKHMKHNNKLIQEKVDEQIEALYRKREEIIKEQQEKELKLEDKIRLMEDDIDDLRQSLAQRMKLYGDEDYSGDYEVRSRDSSAECTMRSCASPTAPYLTTNSFQKLTDPHMYASGFAVYDESRFEVEKKGEERKDDSKEGMKRTTSEEHDNDTLKGEEDDIVVEDLNVDEGGETYEDVEEVCYPTLPASMKN